MIGLMNNVVHDAAVLYVDDEEMARKYFGRALNGEYEVLTAPDADAAIGMLRDDARQIGVLVTDYRMPGRSGGDLLRQIEREFPHVVRIMVTAYAEREVLLDAVNSGEVFRILEKPLDPGEVREALRGACDLSRDRAVQQQKLMAMDETLAFLAHELNTPLAAIVNFAQGVGSRVSGEDISRQQQAEIGRAAAAVDDNARYCLSLLSSFVESVRSMGALVAPHAGCTARQMIASLLDAYPLTSEQRAAIHVEEGEDFVIGVLPNCVALVLSSVLNNALRAVRERTAPEISFAVQAQGNPQIRISDNGPGIPPHVMERLLVDPVTTRTDAAGKGWGMIFCKRIMQSFGGGIRVHSAPGEPTVVTLNFPAVKNQRSE